MITDSETNFIYFSELITKDKYKLFWERIHKILFTEKICYGFIKKTRNIWCRDYMPIQLSDRDYLQFEYFPDYLICPKYIHTLTNQKEVQILDFNIKAKISALIIDGGNVVKSKSKVILTNKIFADNQKSYERKTIESQLTNELGKVDIYYIPKQSYDYTGHADGMIRFLDENTIIVSDYSNESKSWKKEYETSLKKTGLNIELFPSFTDQKKNEDGDFNARGCYINFAMIGNIILLPQFNDDNDELAVKRTEELFPNCKVIPVDSNEIAYEGGVLNCITWNIKK